MPDRVRTRDALTSPSVVIGLVFTIVLGAIGLAVGAEIGGLNSQTTPVVTTVLAMLAPALVGLVALTKAEKVDRKTDAVNEKVDGHMAKLVDIALKNGASHAELSEATGGAVPLPVRTEPTPTPPPVEPPGT